jgi:hypothetical protein
MYYCIHVCAQVKRARTAARTMKTLEIIEKDGFIFILLLLLLLVHIYIYIYIYFPVDRTAGIVSMNTRRTRVRHGARYTRR